MKTYDGFGMYTPTNLKDVKFYLSVPHEKYRFEFANISNKGRNGIVISFKIDPDDPDTELKNPELNFEEVTLDLELIESLKVPDMEVESFDYSKPIYVYTYHDADITKYLANTIDCFHKLCDYNSSSERGSKSGIGGLKKY